MTQRLVCSGTWCLRLPEQERSTLEIPGRAAYWECASCRERMRQELLALCREVREAAATTEEVSGGTAAEAATGGG